MSRLLCQFSCGAASAVATKLVIAEASAPVLVVNAYLAAEPEDNRRFLADCERWFGHPVTVLRDEKYGAEPLEVFRRRGFMKGPHGASCSGPLKRDLLRTLEQPGDVLVLGFTEEERGRFDDFQQQWPDRPARAPLIERGLTKDDCKAMIERAGIELPLMYRLGYDNANCIGCVKGGAGYFRAIREDFPERFKALADVEQSIGPGAYILYHRSGPLEGQRFPLHELPAGEPRRNEAVPACSFYCLTAEQDYKPDDARIDALTQGAAHG